MSSHLKMSAATEKVIMTAGSKYPISLIFEDFCKLLETFGVCIHTYKSNS